MPTLLTFDFYGDEQLNRTLDRFAIGAQDARPAWEAIANRFRHVEARQFATEGKAASGGWAPLSDNPPGHGYKSWKAMHYPGKPILQREGALITSLTQRPFGIERIEPQAMWLGSDVPYGRYHQQGTPRMPRRRPIELTEAERRLWVKILQRFLVTGVAPGIGPRGGVSR